MVFGLWSLVFGGLGVGAAWAWASRRPRPRRDRARTLCRLWSCSAESLVPRRSAVLSLRASISFQCASGSAGQESDMRKGVSLIAAAVLAGMAVATCSISVSGYRRSSVRRRRDSPPCPAKGRPGHLRRLRGGAGLAEGHLDDAGAPKGGRSAPARASSRRARTASSCCCAACCRPSSARWFAQHRAEHRRSRSADSPGATPRCRARRATAAPASWRKPAWKRG